MHYAAIARRRQRAPFVLIERTGPRTLESIIAASALMAMADGTADASEQTGMLEFLRRHGILGVLGRGPTLDRFTAAVGRVDVDAADRVTASLRPLAGTGGARLVAAAAACVAAADGVVVPAEHALLHRLRTELGLLPANLA